jgi:hypothetical protein
MDVKIEKKELKKVLGGFLQTYNSLVPFPDGYTYLIKTDDKGKTTIQFGDGIRGVRPPSGSSNIEASYGSGGSSKD